ncbi:site-2 protease family protein [Peredibacter starrii]|uniref:Site-2 protease family protein n=1 Tax=Peredibacter starrii TaxID=28202 RepID=A0AAX4HRB2_9BACT|nr:site-2 protease family protein [Peredibacter starrii]WPU65884.1 site-2 protease family protein [Peredibacter starrii]
MNDLNTILFNIAQSLPGFLLAIVTHEAAHAWMANKFGDPTAKNAGRLTLNPAAHYDPWGTIFFPLLAAVTNFAMIGWARPVPIEVRNFKKIRSGIFWVSFAGPLSNLLLGTLSALVLAVIATKVSPDWGYYRISIRMLQYSVFINFILAFFNLIPLPPLDGSKMVSSFLKGQALYKYENFARYTPVIFLMVMALSFMGIHTLSYVLMPAQVIANYLMFTFVGLFGGIV